MKKLMYFIAVAIITTGISCNVKAQDISIGGGISYGFDIEEIGIQLSGTYGLNENMRVGADIVYYLIGTESFFGEEISTTALEVNFNFKVLRETLWVEV
ncbi:MAG: hypothetical protein EA391_11715 [Balneolaceae bacterium]|nr:MAG: hypothetical protein EA391_11715 [Balneolaceae bacterium]